MAWVIMRRKSQVGVRERSRRKSTWPVAVLQMNDGRMKNVKRSVGLLLVLLSFMPAAFLFHYSADEAAFAEENPYITTFQALQQYDDLDQKYPEATKLFERTLIKQIENGYGMSYMDASTADIARVRLGTGFDWAVHSRSRQEAELAHTYVDYSGYSLDGVMTIRYATDNAERNPLYSTPDSADVLMLSFGGALYYYSHANPDVKQEYLGTEKVIPGGPTFAYTYVKTPGSNLYSEYPTAQFVFHEVSMDEIYQYSTLNVRFSESANIIRDGGSISRREHPTYAEYIKLLDILLKKEAHPEKTYAQIMLESGYALYDANAVYPSYDETTLWNAVLERLVDEMSQTSGSHNGMHVDYGWEDAVIFQLYDVGIRLKIPDGMPIQTNADEEIMLENKRGNVLPYLSTFAFEGCNREAFFDLSIGSDPNIFTLIGIKNLGLTAEDVRNTMNTYAMAYGRVSVEDAAHLGQDALLVRFVSDEAYVMYIIPREEGMYMITGQPQYIENVIVFDEISSYMDASSVQEYFSQGEPYPTIIGSNSLHDYDTEAAFLPISSLSDDYNDETSLYAPILEGYRQAVINAEYLVTGEYVWPVYVFDWEPLANVTVDESFVEKGEPLQNHFGYAFRDLNGDQQPELILISKNYWIYAVITQTNDETPRYFGMEYPHDGGTFSGYSLNSDGALIIDAEGPMNRSISTYRLNASGDAFEMQGGFGYETVFYTDKESEAFFVMNGTGEKVAIPETEYRDLVSLAYFNGDTNKDVLTFISLFDDLPTTSMIPREQGIPLTARETEEFFRNLPDKFEFSSGAGGWWSEISIGNDGSFTGYFFDSEWGNTGPDYPDGTVYESYFYGRFTDVREISKFEYSATLEYVLTVDEAGIETISSETRVITSGAVGLEDADEIRFYITGRATDDLPYEFLDWVGMPNVWGYGENGVNAPAELPFDGMYNVAGQLGFYSAEKKMVVPTPDYALAVMYNPEDGNTYYDRVYDDAYRVRISEQGYRVEQARSRNYPDWSTWGKGADSIGVLDCALLAAVPNMSHQEAWDYLIENFPDACPIFQSEFIHRNDWGVNYCVFRIDDNNAIVSFGGTNASFGGAKSVEDGLIDLITDALADYYIGIGGNFMNAQAITAINIIKDLPYDNIIAIGYSLGGYLAADATLNNSKVNECITFNAPGRFLDLNTIINTDARIKNYSPAGDVVHSFGVQPGLAFIVEIDKNAPIWGPFGTHDLQDLINAFCE